jgi:hypothetical protein
MEFLSLAKRPKQSSVVSLKKVNLLSNYYTFRFTNSAKQKIFKYAIHMVPDIPENSLQMRNKVIRVIRPELKDKYLGFFISIGNCLYSLENSPEIPVMQSELDKIKYEVKITWVQSISDMDLDRLNFYKIFFNSLLKKI